MGARVPICAPPAESASKLFVMTWRPHDARVNLQTWPPREAHGVHERPPAARADARGSPDNSTLMRKVSGQAVPAHRPYLPPPRAFRWQYQRGQRSLLQNLGVADATAAGDEASAAPDDDDDDDDDDDADVPPELEDVLDQLLNGLRDRDTVVRWSAAKGIGRVTGRLPRPWQMTSSARCWISFSPSEGDGAWHGACLALAEARAAACCCHRAFPQAVPCVIKAIHYDVRRGSNRRDYPPPIPQPEPLLRATIYLWSYTRSRAYLTLGRRTAQRGIACARCGVLRLLGFARAYSPNVMCPFVDDLSEGMLLTALFDREVNCRRAAAAAFQENVGRQGHENFAHGIDILTAADFFTLGNRVNAYVEISCFVARFDKYRLRGIDHLSLGHAFPLGRRDSRVERARAPRADQARSHAHARIGAPEPAAFHDLRRPAQAPR